MDPLQQKRIWNAGYVFLIILTIFVVVKTTNEIRSSSYIGSDTVVKNVIHVTGQGKVLAKPDIATFSFSIESESKVVTDAQKIVSDKSDKVNAFLKDTMKITDADIATTNYTIYPRYVYTQYRVANQDDRALAGYVVSQTMTVKLRDVTKTGTLLSGIGNLGVANISGPSFTVDKQEDLQKDARVKAIAEAKANAEKLAKDLGVRLVRIADFSESGTTPGPIYMEKSMVANMSAPAMDALPTGQSEITSNVTITYEIR
jgi:uncharacterized protein YggE